MHVETVSSCLWNTLIQLMKIEILDSFYLVGGTSLSLRLGHRMSVDIDMFTDLPYGSPDFNLIDERLQQEFAFVGMSSPGNDSFGKSYHIGETAKNTVKLDLFYTDAFIRPIELTHSIRMASLEDICAMKMEVIGNGGRKKDFWDLHELLDYYSLPQILGFYGERYPYSYSEQELKEKLTDFQFADDDFDPICLKGKYWELIREDFIEIVDTLK